MKRKSRGRPELSVPVRRKQDVIEGGCRRREVVDRERLQTEGDADGERLQTEGAAEFREEEQSGDGEKTEVRWRGRRAAGVG
ncbi:hypothetical protein RYX36_004263 [Vicia faba]